MMNKEKTGEMRKKLFAAAGTLMIAYVLFSAGVGAAPGGEARTGETDRVVYTMRAEEGRVVVYRNDDRYLRTDTAVSSLPKADRRKLQTGITVYSEEELKRLIEDICS